MKSATITPQGGTAVIESWTYSATGNMLSKTDVSGTKNYTYGDGRHPHAVTKFGADTYTYDAAGNMVSEVRGGQAITYGYDGFNRLATITNGAGVTTYIYGAGYDRVQKKLPNGKITTYFGELAELDETGAWTDYLFLGARRIATVQNGAMYYNVGDHLGSASLELDAAGAVVQKLDYLPYGAERVNVKTTSFDTHFTYTDQERDAESGLLYYGARYYHPVLGRFMQVDPLVITPTAQAFVNPQMWNAYSYAGNNPLRYLDPTGMGAVEAMGDFFYGFNYRLYGGLSGGLTNGVTVVPSNTTASRIGQGFGRASALMAQGAEMAVGAHQMVQGISTGIRMVGQGVGAGQLVVNGVIVAEGAIVGTMGAVGGTQTVMRSDGTDTSTGGGENKKITINDKDAQHMFRNSPGHIQDTPANRQLLTDTANNQRNYLGPDQYGNEWYAQTLDDGRQAWVGVRDGHIRYGGVNNVPEVYNPKTGLSSPIKS